jgi:hypothetical protein
VSNLGDHFSSEDAETVLFALALRSKQKGLSPEQAERAVQLGKYLNVRFETAFGWMKYDRMKHMRRPIKSVNIKVYDIAPEGD